MLRKISLNSINIKYSLKRNAFSKCIRVKIGNRGVVVTAPKNTGLNLIENFLKENENWIKSNLTVNQPENSLSDFVRNKADARKIVKERLEYFNKMYGFKYAKIYIRNQSTRWGSCSGKGNLSFNYRLTKLPLDLVDYVVVHELCHLKEMNHSDKFWKLVEKCIPDYKLRRKRLKSLE